jgi:hypothetical protein
MATHESGAKGKASRREYIRRGAHLMSCHGSTKHIHANGGMAMQGWEKCGERVFQIGDGMMRGRERGSEGVGEWNEDRFFCYILDTPVCGFSVNDWSLL